MGYTLKNIKLSPFKGLDYSFISSDYGPRSFYNNMTGRTVNDFHDGIDMTSGSYIVAILDGKVIESRNNVSGYNESLALAAGNYVKIDHGNGLFSLYAHMKYGSVPVKAGDYVTKGDVIGRMGATGFATGAHLHLGICLNGKWIDPKKYILDENISKEENKEFIEYLVVKGDTLSGIAFKYNVKLEDLIKINNISNPNLIFINQKLLIPTNDKTNLYIVKPGDTLSSIALNNGTTWEKIYEQNKDIIGSNPHLIIPGQRLKL